MTQIKKPLLALAMTGALLLPSISTAQADQRHGWRGHKGGHHQQHRPHRKHGKRHNNNVGAAAVAGIIGLAAGAIILGAASQPRYSAPARDYYPPQPYPGRVHGGRYGLQPWSPAWYRYCSDKFRSFNPSTGTYTTYRGEQRFCQ